MHVSHAFHMHEPGTDARIWTCDVWWAAHIGAAHICNIVWCICLSNRPTSEDVIKADSLECPGFDSACAPGCRTQLHVTTSLRTGGGPVSYMQLSEGGFQVVYPLGLWSRFSGVVKVRFGYG